MAKELSPEGLEPIDLAGGNEESPVEAVAEAAEPTPEIQEESAPEEKTIENLDAEFEANFLKQLEAAQDGSEPEPEPEPEPAQESEPEVDSPAAANFKKIKQDRDNIRNERDSYKAQLDELQKKLENMDNSDVNSILNDVKKEKEYLSEQLKVANLERHPEFQQRYENKIKQIVDGAKAAVGEEYGERMGELVQMGESAYRNQQIEEIMVELTETQKSRMGALLTRMDEVRAERAEALNNADLTYTQLIERQNAESNAAFEADEKIFNEVSSGFVKNLEAFQLREGDDEYNKGVQDRLDTARQLFNGKDNTAQDLIEATHWAVAGPFYRQKLVEAMELNKRLRGKNKDMASATPTTSSSDLPSDSSGTEANFEDKFAELTGMDISSYR